MIEAQHRRGRTSRRRSKRSDSAKHQNLSNDASVVLLVQWMCKKGWKATSKLRLVTCNTTGRGLQTLNGVKTGDTLVRIPDRLLITYNTACRYFRIQNLQMSFPEHHLLALFVVSHIRIGNASDWFPYCQLLPKNFTTPAFLSEKELNYLPSFIQNLAIEQKNKLNEAFRKASELWESLVLHRKISSTFLPLTFDEFRSAWFVVNTRSVYMEKQMESNLFSPFKSSKRICMALAPYLDMFNHSFDATVKAGFNTNSGSYEIHSLKSYPPRSQVFINYGPHDNLKLYADYGFFLPGNPHDCIVFRLNEILSYVTVIYPISSIEGSKMEFLLKHNLLADLSCNREGLSWNMSVLIYILAIKDFSCLSCLIVFRGDWVSYGSEIEKQIALHIVKCKRLELLELQNQMLSNVNCSDSFEVAKNILKEYISILLCAEKSYTNYS